MNAQRLEGMRKAVEEFTPNSIGASLMHEYAKELLSLLDRPVSQDAQEVDAQLLKSLRDPHKVDDGIHGYWSDPLCVAAADKIEQLLTALQSHADAARLERDEIINAVLGKVGKRWRSMSIEDAGNVEINGPTAAIVADQPGAALVAVEMALTHLEDAARLAGEREIQRLRDENEALKQIVRVGTGDDPGATIIELRKLENNARLAERERIRVAVTAIRKGSRGIRTSPDSHELETFVRRETVLAAIDGQPVEVANELD